MEEFIVEAIETEDPEAVINEIMKSYGQDVLQLVYSYVHNKATAEDLTQDIFVKCYQQLHTYKKKAKIKTWLWRIAINHCKDYLKSWHYIHVSVSDVDFTIPEANETNVEHTVVQQSEDEKLTASVMQLPVNYREVIYLFYFEELSLKEIAAVTKQNVNTVKTRLRRAKTLLQEMLGGE